MNLSAPSVFALQSFACSSIRKLVRSLIGLCVCCVIRA